MEEGRERIGREKGKRVRLRDSFSGMVLGIWGFPCKAHFYLS